MTATLWTKGGKLIIGSGDQPILCEICPCPGEGGHVSPCNDNVSVPDQLTMTIFFNSVSVDVPLHWVVGESACSGAEGWVNGGAELVLICDDFYFVDAALCCQFDVGLDAWIWYFEFVYKKGGVVDVFETGGGGIDPVVVVDTDPIDYEITIPGFTACSVTDDIVISINPAP